MDAPFGLEEIMRILPHRSPMLLVDEVRSLSPGESVEAAWLADPARDFFRGHFPGSPVVPGVYLVECMAQAADLLLLTDERYRGKTPYLAGVDKARFMSPVLPGDTVEITARFLSERPEVRLAVYEASVAVAGKKCAMAHITLAPR